MKNNMILKLALAAGFLSGQAMANDFDTLAGRGLAEVLETAGEAVPVPVTPQPAGDPSRAQKRRVTPSGEIFYQVASAPEEMGEAWSKGGRELIWGQLRAGIVEAQDRTMTPAEAAAECARFGARLPTAEESGRLAESMLESVPYHAPCGQGGNSNPGFFEFWGDQFSQWFGQGKADVRGNIKLFNINRSPLPDMKYGFWTSTVHPKYPEFNIVYAINHSMYLGTDGNSYQGYSDRALHVRTNSAETGMHRTVGYRCVMSPKP